PRPQVPTAGAAAPHHGRRHRREAVPGGPPGEVRLIQRVCVVGAGSIGSLYAAHLATVCDATVLTRRPEHAAALNSEGLQVSGRHDFTARVTAAAAAADLPAPDLVIVANKTTGLQSAAAAMEGHFPGATVMTVQNGLGAEDAVRSRGS